MKRLLLLKSLLLLFLFVSCSKDGYSVFSKSFPRESVETFERGYLASNSIVTKSLNEERLIHLVGYALIKYNGKAAEQEMRVWEEHKSEIEEAGCYLISGSQARVYFPLSFANVEIDGDIYLADSLGYINVPVEHSIESIKVKGREKSYRCSQVMFAKSMSPVSSYEDMSAFVFYVGERPVSCHESHSKSLTKTRSEEGNGHVACVDNHSPYRNCTEAFPEVATGRCIVMYDRCMDYNGFGTDCSGSGHFLGSDCCLALAQGKCWEEVRKSL